MPIIRVPISLIGNGAAAQFLDDRICLLELLADINHLLEIVIFPVHTAGHTNTHTHTHTRVYAYVCVVCVYVHTHTHTHTHEATKPQLGFGVGLGAGIIQKKVPASWMQRCTAKSLGLQLRWSSRRDIL